MNWDRDSADTPQKKLTSTDNDDDDDVVVSNRPRSRQRPRGCSRIPSNSDSVSYTYNPSPKNVVPRAKLSDYRTSSMSCSVSCCITSSLGHVTARPHFGPRPHWDTSGHYHDPHPRDHVSIATLDRTPAPRTLPLVFPPSRTPPPPLRQGPPPSGRCIPPSPPELSGPRPSQAIRPPLSLLRPSCNELLGLGCRWVSPQRLPVLHFEDRACCRPRGTLPKEVTRRCWFESAEITREAVPVPVRIHQVQLRAEKGGFLLSRSAGERVGCGGSSSRCGGESCCCCTWPRRLTKSCAAGVSSGAEDFPFQPPWGDRRLEVREVFGVRCYLPAGPVRDVVSYHLSMPSHPSDFNPSVVVVCKRPWSRQGSHR